MPIELVERLRPTCLQLPDAYEEPAWVGTRWRIRKRTFAHVLRIEAGWPPAYARAAGVEGPADVLTFRSSGAELASLAGVGHPFFLPRWWPDIAGMVLEPGSDWDEVAELLTESYRLLAPKSLAKGVTA